MAETILVDIKLMCSLFASFSSISPSFWQWYLIAAEHHDDSFAACSGFWPLTPSQLQSCASLQFAQPHNQLKVFASNYVQIRAAWWNKTDGTLSSLSTLSRENFVAEANRCAQQLVYCSSSDTLSLEIGIFIYSHFSRKAHTVKNVVELLPFHEMWLEACTV